VPFNSFSEFNKAEGGDIWFALDETRPLACFAGIWANWTSEGQGRDQQRPTRLPDNRTRRSAQFIPRRCRSS